MRTPLLLLTLLVCTATVQAQGALLSVEVRDTDRAGLAGATVIVSGPASRGGVTDASGTYRAEGLPGGSYRVEVRMMGFGPARQSVTLTDGEETLLAMALAETAYDLSEVVVGTTRMATPLTAVTGAVTVIERDEIESHAAVSTGLGEVLGATVPGLSVGTQSMSNFGQSLRGRNVVVLIDGVPQSTLRNVSRDFATIDPSVIERVEVLRGATALYGDGATGGVINLLTRSPGAGRPTFRTSMALLGSLTAGSEGLGQEVTQGVSGGVGIVRYTASATLGRTGSFFDADGDRMLPDPHGQGGLADSRSVNLFAKIGLDTPRRRGALSLTRYVTEQHTRYTADPSTDAFPKGEAKARAIAGLDQEIPQGTRNTIVNAEAEQEGLFGSRVRVQGFLRDYNTVFRPFDRRRTKEFISQSFVDSRTVGGRLEAETPLLRGGRASLLWGADVKAEETAQPVYVMDEAAYVESGGREFRRTGERLWVPPLRPRSAAGFAQLAVRPLSRVQLRGGVRIERVRLQVDDFTTLAGNAVTGGELDYAPTLFNVGATVDVLRRLNVFASYAQGFSLADIGRVLRSARAGFTVGSASLPAPTVDHYEAGLRGGVGPVAFTGSVFTSRSKLGTSLKQDASGVLFIDPSPERVYGAEGTVDVRLARTVDAGGTLSWTEGESFNVARNTYVALNGYRIQPPKATAHLGHRAGRWTNRILLLYSGTRTRAFDARVDPAKPAAYGEQPIDAFTTLDYTGTVRLGRGTLRLGIDNLLNARYFDIVSQLDVTDGNLYHSAARGRAFTLGYAFTY